MESEVRKAVIVEDSARFRDLLKLALSSFGIHDVIEAKDGKDALEVLEKTDVDVVVMDWTMVGMDGIACTRHIRNGMTRNTDVPIIMVTGRGGEDNIQHAYAVGVDVYLVKPISLKSLHGGIERAIGMPRDRLAVAACAG